MSYIGREPTFGTHIPTEVLTGDGTTTVFNLSRQPGSSQAIDVAISGVVQRPEYSYVVVGKQLQFTSAPPVPLDGNPNILVKYNSNVPTQFNNVGIAVEQQEFTATEGQTVFTLTGFTYTPGSNQVNVYINGIKQHPTSYLETSSTVITITEGVSLDSKVLVVKGELVNQDSRTSQQVSYQLDATGGVGRTAFDKLKEFVSVKDFGAVGDGVIDDTTAIQDALNYASSSQTNTIYFPAGHYKYTNLYLYNAGDAGYTGNGTIALVGDGRPNVAQLRANTFTNGTILESTAATGNALAISGASQAQGVIIKNLMLTGNTTGYIVYGEYNPQFVLEEVSVSNQSTSGGGISIAQCWFTKLSNVWIEFTGAGTSTGKGVVLANASISGGLVGIDESSAVWSWGTGVSIEDGAWTNIYVDSSEIGGCEVAGFSNTVSTDSISLTNVYFESNKQDIVATGKIKVFKLDGAYILGGTDTAGEASTRISLSGGVQAGRASNIYCFRPWSNLVDVAGDGTAWSNFEISHISYIHDNSGALTSPIYVVKPLGNVTVDIKDVTFTGGSADLDTTGNMRVIDTSVSSKYSYQSTNGVMPYGLASDIVDATLDGTTTTVGFTFKYRRYTTTAATIVDVSAVATTSAGMDGTFFFIENSSSSAERIQVRQQNDSTTKGYLVPGETAIVWYDRTARNVLMRKLQSSSAKSITHASAAPVSGTWRQGDIVWNSAPSAGGAPGWMCTAAGTPGTWKAMANLAV